MKIYGSKKCNFFSGKFFHLNFFTGVYFLANICLKKNIKINLMVKNSGINGVE